MNVPRHPNATTPVLHSTPARDKTGIAMDFIEQLRPLAQLMRRRRNELGLTAEKVGASVGMGMTWCSELEAGKGTVNPSLRRLTQWAQALDVQEFGVYVVIDGHHTAVPVYETDDADLSPTADETDPPGSASPAADR